MVHRQDVVTTRGAPSRLSEEGSATVMVRVRGLKWFGVNAASVLRLATPCNRWVEIWCVCYPCMSHSGKGLRCVARGCNKHVRPVKGETRELQCVFHRFMAFKRCIHPGCFNDALQGGVCWCHGANTKLCCYDAKLFDESTKNWIVSRCTHYARKGGECTMHGGNIQQQRCSYNERGQKCTNRARNGGVCYDHYIEGII